MSRAAKALKSIFIDGNTYRIWQIIFKSPLIGLFAFLHGLAKPRLKKFRRELLNSTALTETQKKIVNELNEKGFSRVDALFSPEDLKPLESYIADKTSQVSQAKEQQLSTHKDFWIRLSDTDFTQGMTTQHPLVQLSIKPSVLQTIGAYLKSAPYLEYILLTYSLPSVQPYKASQLWHHDHDNDRMLKLFFYLTDVEDVADGPFTLLPKEANRVIPNSFIPKHLSDELVNSYYPLSKSVQIKGKKFAAFVVDTSVCYHMGSRVAEGHARLMSTSLYVSIPKAYWGQLKPFVKIDGSVTDLQKAALVINPES